MATQSSCACCETVEGAVWGFTPPPLLLVLVPALPLSAAALLAGSPDALRDYETQPKI